MIRPWIHKQNRPWLSNWTYRKSFTLSRASGAVTDYQMKLLVGEAASVTVGSDLISNGGFPSNTTGWTVANGSILSVAGGQYGNCCQVTRTGGNYQYVRQAAIAVRVGIKYKITIYVKSGTSGNEAFDCGVYVTSGEANIAYLAGTSSGSWVQYSATFISTTTSVFVQFNKNSATAGTMLLDTVTLYEIPYIDCGGLCASDFDDIRFTKSDGTTVLDYWIESISGATPNQLATIWVEFDSIGTSATTFYMYYGNGYANKYSNGENTFILFDDFDQGTLDTNKWDNSDTGTGSRTFLGSIMTQAATAAGGEWWIRPKTNSFGRISVEALVRTNGARRAFESLGIGGGSDGISVIYETSPVQRWYYAWLDAPTWTDGTLEASNGALWRIVVVANGGATSNMAVYDSSRILITNISAALDLGASTSIAAIGARYVSASCSHDLDWVFIRQYLATEPAWGSWGAQET